MTGYRTHTGNTSTRDHGANWRDRAACRDEDPELFFPIGNTGPALLQIKEAKAICRRCPVRPACLRWSLDNQVTDGIWGGVDQDERHALLKRQHRPAPAVPVIDRIRDLARRGYSDPQIAARLPEDIGWKRVQTLRLAERIPAGQHPQPLRDRGVA
jgi:WhiB family redox-sensing transcriptional regulator